MRGGTYTYIYIYAFPSVSECNWQTQANLSVFVCWLLSKQLNLGLGSNKHGLREATTAKQGYLISACATQWSEVAGPGTGSYRLKIEVKRTSPGQNHNAQNIRS